MDVSLPFSTGSIFSSWLISVCDLLWSHKSYYILNIHIGEPRLRTIKNKTNLLKYFRRPSCLCSNKDIKGKYEFAHNFNTVECITTKFILRLEIMPMSIATNFWLNTPTRSRNTVPHLNTDHITFTAKKQILIIFRPYLRNGLSD